MTKGNDIRAAAELTPGDIGTLIRIRTWDNNTEIATVQTGELRQLSANQAEVHLIIGVGAETEVTLAHDQPVTLRPTADYNDVPTLALYDERV